MAVLRVLGVGNALFLDSSCLHSSPHRRLSLLLHPGSAVYSWCSRRVSISDRKAVFEVAPMECSCNTGSRWTDTFPQDVQAGGFRHRGMQPPAIRAIGRFWVCAFSTAPIPWPVCRVYHFQSTGATRTPPAFSCWLSNLGYPRHSIPFTNHFRLPHDPFTLHVRWSS